MKKLFYILPLLILLSFGVWYFVFSPLAKGGLRGVSDATSSKAEAAAPREGLVAYWTMDNGDTSRGILYDKSGNRLNGVFYGTTTSTGRIGQGRDFNGSSDYIEVQDNSLLTLGTQFTLSAWVNIDAISENADSILNKNAQVDCNDEWGWGFWPAGTQRFFWDTTGVGSWGSTDCNGLSSDSAITLKKWTHVAVVRNGTNITFYQDGVVGGSSEAIDSDPINNLTTTLRIGTQARGGYNRYIDGKLDEIRIYNRALSAQEINAIYVATNKAEMDSPAVTASSTVGQLVGYWTMDDGDRSRNLIYDKSGNTKNGTLVGTTTSTGRIGQARDFNGSSDRISLPNIDFSGNNLTIAGWIKVDGAGGSDWQMILSDRNTSSDYPMMFSVYQNTKLRLSTNDLVPAPFTSTLAPLKFGKWTHVAVVYNGSSVTFYFDGVADTPIAVTSGSISDTASYTAIGSDYCGGCPDGWYDFFNGSIDELRVYDYALSAEEIADLYAAGNVNTKAASPTREGLVGHWTMDSGDHSRNYMYDKSGNNVHGILVGSSTSTGIINQARDFNGTSDRINIPYSILYRFTTAMGIGGWAYRDNWNTTTNQKILSKTEVGGYQIGLHVGGGGENSVSFLAYINSAYRFATYSLNNLSRGWHHFFGTYDGRYLKLYVDGVLRDTYDAGGNYAITYSHNNSLMIGAEPNTTNGTEGYYFDGVIDEIRAYNRVLTAQEIMNLYQAGIRETKMR